MDARADSIEGNMFSNERGGRQRLVEVMGHRSPSRIRDIVKKWVSVEKDLQRKRAGAYAGLKKAVREHCVWGGGGEGL